MAKRGRKPGQKVESNIITLFTLNNIEVKKSDHGYIIFRNKHNFYYSTITGVFNSLLEDITFNEYFSSFNDIITKLEKTKEDLLRVIEEL